MISIFLTAGNVQLAGLLVEREEVEAHRARDDQRHANTGGVLLLFALFTSNVFRGYNFFRGSIYGSQCLKLTEWPVNCDIREAPLKFMPQAFGHCP